MKTLETSRLILRDWTIKDIGTHFMRSLDFQKVWE